MTHSIRIYGDNGIEQIDGDFRNFVFRDSGTLQMVSYGSIPPSQTMGGQNGHLLLCRTANGRALFFEQYDGTIKTPNVGMSPYTNFPSPTQVHFVRLDPATQISSPDWGLQVFNGGSEAVIDSRNVIATVVFSVTLSGWNTNTTSSQSFSIPPVSPGRQRYINVHSLTGQYNSKNMVFQAITAGFSASDQLIVWMGGSQGAANSAGIADPVTILVVEI